MLTGDESEELTALREAFACILTNRNGGVFILAASTIGEVMDQETTIRPEFCAYLLNQNGADRMKQVRLGFTVLLNQLDTVCPAGREYSLVKTHLEEACFFAVRAIAAQPANQGVIQPKTEKSYEAILDEYDMEATKARNALTAAGIPEGGSLADRIKALDMQNRSLTRSEIDLALPEMRPPIDSAAFAPHDQL